MDISPITAARGQSQYAERAYDAHKWQTFDMNMRRVANIVSNRPAVTATEEADKAIGMSCLERFEAMCKKYKQLGQKLENAIGEQRKQLETEFMNLHYSFSRNVASLSDRNKVIMKNLTELTNFLCKAK